MPLLRYDSSVLTNGREKSIHETGKLPVASYEDDVSVHPIAWHWHDEFELFHLLHGNINMLIGTCQLTMTAGDAIFINSELLHGGWEDYSESCPYHSLVFHPQLIGGAVTSVFWQNYLNPLRLNKALPYLLFRPDVGWQSKVIENLEKSWTEIELQSAGFEFRVREALSSIIYEVFTHSGEYSQSSTYAQQHEEVRLKQMIAFVQEHFTDEISVGDIAASAFISKTECMRCFRNVLHTSPNRYLRQLRIRHAERILRSTNYKVETIAAYCGFQDTSYFARCFREEFGTTPLNYRKNLSAGQRTFQKNNLGLSH